ncbi:MAG: sensor domain-containing diguanylate cyclase, partial [Peptostreptococcaceae bacterium]
VFILINVMAQKIIVDNVISLESDRMNEEISRIINELDNQLESIKHTIHDYSEWDDAYEYVTARSNYENMAKWMKFEKDNLGVNSMQGVGLNAIMVLNNDAEVIYKLGYDGVAISGDKIPNKLQEFVTNKAYINSLDALSEEIGIIGTEQGLFLVGIHPILKNSGIGTKNGVMVMARKLDESELEKLLPNFSIEILDIENSQNIQTQKTNDLNTRNFENPHIYITNINGYSPKVDAYGYIKDLTGKQVIKIDLNTEEGLIKNINMNKYLFLGIFLLYFIIIGFTWYFLYDNFVSRINHILKSISKLKNNGLKIIDDEIETQDELEIVEKKIELLVDALNNHYEEIMYSANTDYLTNLYNRVGFNREIQQYIQDTNNEKAKAALLFLDIDKFKNINDVYGHNIGDEVLKRFARRLFDNA